MGQSPVSTVVVKVNDTLDQFVVVGPNWIVAPGGSEAFDRKDTETRLGATLPVYENPEKILSALSHPATFTPPVNRVSRVTVVHWTGAANDGTITAKITTTNSRSFFKSVS